MMRSLNRVVYGFPCLVIFAWLSGCARQDRATKVDGLHLSGGTCNNCRVVLERLVTLHSPDDTTDLSLTATVTTPDRDVWVVAPTADGAHVAFFDSSGRARGLIGTRGAGPGEFARISAVVPATEGDLILFDLVLRRVTKMTVAGDVLWTNPIAYSPSIRPAQMPGSGFLVPAVIGTPEAFGLPLHLADSSGSLLKDFGAEVVADGAPISSMYRVVSVGPDSGLWSAPLADPVLEKWTADGGLLDTIAFAMDWFPRVAGRPVSDTNAEFPSIAALHVTNGDLAYILVTTETDAFSDSPSNGAEGSPLDAASLAARLRSRLVVVDSRSHALLGSVPLPGFFPEFADTGLSLVRLSADSIGAVTFDVYRLRLERPEADTVRGE
jgi:hypothetical protein